MAVNKKFLTETCHSSYIAVDLFCLSLSHVLTFICYFGADFMFEFVNCVHVQCNIIVIIIMVILLHGGSVPYILL